ILLNVAISSWCADFGRAPRRVLVDCDAPLTQIQLAEDRYPLTPIVGQHDTRFTYAVNLAEGRSRGPDGGRPWLATRPPVHLGSWTPSPPPRRGPWSTVSSWGSTPERQWDGVVYGQKARSYRAILDLPARVAVPLELAVAGDAPVDDLTAAGWRVVDPVEVTRSLDTFTGFVQRSRGELGVAKHAFVRARSGAFNDRALAYLASGRPVACSDTGLSWLPPSDGFFPFDDVASAAAAISRAEEDIDAAGRAARRFAEEHFAADAVVRDLLRAADVALPAPTRAGLAP
ncbi:MAG: hypothetical protein ACRDJP_01155, partial [Actinomycetota bacterium]